MVSESWAGRVVAERYELLETYQEQLRLLILLGTKDAGKTFAGGIAVDEALVRWLANPWRGRGAPSAPAMVAAEFLADAWMYWDKTKDGREPVEPSTGLNKELLLSASLLVVDDSGHEPANKTEIVGEATDILVCRRCDRGLRTLLTSNYMTDVDLLARYKPRDQRLGERFTEHGMQFNCPAVNLRRRTRRAGEGAST